MAQAQMELEMGK